MCVEQTLGLNAVELACLILILHYNVISSESESPNLPYGFLHRDIGDSHNVCPC